MPFELNDEQKAAVTALRGPVIISAGAGSGKTRTLSERFAHALEPDAEEQWEGVSPAQILTITFTEKAAGELADRIRSTLRAAGQRRQAQEIDNAWISTIHGFCSRILKRYALEAGLDPSFTVAETVTAARMKDGAFERAATETLGTPEGEVLFGDFEFSAVYEAVETLVHALRTRGLSADALSGESHREAEAIHGEATRLLLGAPALIGACGDDGKQAANFIEKCTRAGAELGALEPQALRHDELARMTWRVLADLKFGGSSKKTREAHEEICCAISRLTDEAAAAASAAYVRALVHLTSGYMAAYSIAKRDQGMLDFDDLQYEALRLMETNPAVLSECRQLFMLSMVDEFQDTDALQLGLVNAVAGEHLCTVGDEHQSIYGFRGADIEVFRNHERSMVSKGARKRTLFANYRSHRDILTFVNTLFSAEGLFGSHLEHLTPGRVEPEPPRLPQGEPRVDIVLVHKSGGQADPYRAAEAQAVARRLAALRDAHGFKGGEMVLLVRKYSHADVYAQQLRAAGFDVAVVGGSRFLTLPEVVTARMLLRAIANPNDEVALVHVLSGEAGRVSDDGLLLLRNAGGSIWQAMKEPPSEMGERDRQRVRVVVDVIENAQRRLGHTALSEILLRTTEELDMDLLYLSKGDVGRQAYANVLKLARLAADFEDGVGTGPAAFAAHLDAREEYGEHTPPATLGDDQSSSVRIMSIHSAKGLEFPVVAVAELGSGVQGNCEIVRVGTSSDSSGLVLSAKLPSAKTTREKAERPALFARLDDRAKEAEAEEGRRLFYVAATRAKEVLILSGVGNMEKGPTDSETMLNWLRIAMPQLEPGLGSGPQLQEVGECVVRAETKEVEVGEPEHVTETRVIAEPRELPSSSVQACKRDDALPAPDQLSYTDLALYAECPKRFWASRVLRVGALSIETESDPRRAGSALHAVLQLAHGQLPDGSRIDAIARHYRLSALEAEQMRETAKRFLVSSAGRRLASCEVIRREWSFAVDMSSEECALMLAGAIDAYGRTGDDGLIIDYKSGTSGSEEELRLRYELQARCYALVALKDGCTRVSVIFSRPEVEGSNGGCQEVEYEFGRRDLEQIEEQVRRTHSRMRAGEYPGLAKWDPHVCKECPIIGSLCAVTAPRRR